MGVNRPKKRGRPRKVDIDTGRSGTPVMNGMHPVSASDAAKVGLVRKHDSRWTKTTFSQQYLVEPGPHHQGNPVHPGVKGEQAPSTGPPRPHLHEVPADVPLRRRRRG